MTGIRVHREEAFKVFFAFQRRANTKNETKKLKNEKT